MPLNIPDKLPAVEILESENVFLMKHTQAIHQDIRPLKVVIVNLMPLKIATETHILRLLSNSPLQVEIVLLHTKDHISKNTPLEHLKSFYKTFSQIEKQKFDGMIITGAPIEHLEFEEVDYWEELTRIMLHQPYLFVGVLRLGYIISTGFQNIIFPKKCSEYLIIKSIIP